MKSYMIFLNMMLMLNVTSGEKPQANILSGNHIIMNVTK